MTTLLSKLVLSILFLLSIILYAQKGGKEAYEDLRKHYRDLKKNDTSALKYVEQFISASKNVKDNKALVQAYKDAVMFTESPVLKLKYADSTIYAATKSQDPDLLTSAYLGKGIVYYFNFKKYKLALDEYLKANQYAKNSKDQYLKHKVIYHLGVVKGFLGYYEDAEQHFNDCISYFEKEIQKAEHPNQIYNAKKGYFNSLHQLISVMAYQGNYSKMDSLLIIGLKYNLNASDFPLEVAYFQKCKGILEFYKSQYHNSIIHLKDSEIAISKSQDFAWASVVYFYLGKNYLKLDQKEKAIMEFQKVDSIFNQYQFILPELRANFEFLINYSRDQNDLESRLYYTNQLLRADSIITKDFSYLSTKMHKEYDTVKLREEKEKLERKNIQKLFLSGLLMVILLVFIKLLYGHIKKEKQITHQYQDLQSKLKKEEVVIVNKNLAVRKIDLNDEKYIEISEKLEKFEKKQEFNLQSLTLVKLAKMLGTNTNYLSIFINENKGVNFNTYLKQLRINYITKMINENSRYQNLTVDALAEECGIASRQNFSDAFFEINGIRPKDYIRKRKEESDRK